MRSRDAGEYIAQDVADFISDGALYRLAPGAGNESRPVAELKVSGLDFANGLVIDEARDQLYVAETMADRIIAYRLSVDSGMLSDRRVIANVPTVFHPPTVEHERLMAEWRRHGESGEARLELFGSDMWTPLPGLITGMILTPGDGPVYLTGLGNALVKLP